MPLHFGITLQKAIDENANKAKLFFILSSHLAPLNLKGFYTSLESHLPTDPPFMGRSWDAGLDSVRGGLRNLPGDILIFWIGAERMKEKNPGDYAKAKRLLEAVVEDLEDSRQYPEFIKRADVYFGY